MVAFIPETDRVACNDFHKVFTIALFYFSAEPLGSKCYSNLTSDIACGNSSSRMSKNSGK